jgi:hypothetical protein
VAGLLKVEGMPGPGWTADNFRAQLAVNTAVAAGELALGAWLVSGLFPSGAWWAATGCFGLFTAINLVKILAGERNCGCFGRMQVAPGWMLALDLAVLALLWWCRPPPQEARVSPSAAKGWLLMLLLVPAGAYVATVAWSTLTTVAVGAAGVTVGRRVVLDPERWTGKPFPLLQHLEIGQQLSRSEWVVVFYHEDCSICRAELPEYEQLAARLAQQRGTPRVALVRVPDAPGAAPRPTVWDSACVRCELDTSTEWFVRTPVAVRLNDGVVLGLTTVAEETVKWSSTVLNP